MALKLHLLGHIAGVAGTSRAKRDAEGKGGKPEHFRNTMPMPSTAKHQQNAPQVH